MMFTMTAGSSAQAMNEMASCISEIPGDDDDVSTRSPVPEAPYSMFEAATSLSACTNAPPICGRRCDRYSGISFWGVIG
jgi:hypothetical protein